jgi:hypothetical protein
MMDDDDGTEMEVNEKRIINIYIYQMYLCTVENGFKDLMMTMKWEIAVTVLTTIFSMRMPWNKLGAFVNYWHCLDA